MKAKQIQCRGSLYKCARLKVRLKLSFRAFADYHNLTGYSPATRKHFHFNGIKIFALSSINKQKTNSEEAPTSSFSGMNQRRSEMKQICNTGMMCDTKCPSSQWLQYSYLLVQQPLPLLRTHKCCLHSVVYSVMEVSSLK